MKKTSNEELPQSYGVGLFLGTIAGIASYYVLNTPKGQELKAEIIEQFNRHQEHFKQDIHHFLEEHPLPEPSVASRELSVQSAPSDEQSAGILTKLSRFFVGSSPTQDSSANKPQKHLFTKGGKKLS